MDKYIYYIGNYTCSLMEQVELNRLKYMIGCNSLDNYNIGLVITIFLIVFLISFLYGIVELFEKK